MDKYFKKWERQCIVLTIVSGFIGLACIHYNIPMLAWAIGIYTGIIIRYIPINETGKENETENS